MKTQFNCEFCDEFNGHPHDSTFSRTYKGLIENRVILETSTFYVLPTMGQLFTNSLLIVTKKHIETMAQLDYFQKDELNNLYIKLHEKLSWFGSVVGFEHGAYINNGGGCGIYHAHMHIIPLPLEISITRFIKTRLTIYNSLISTLSEASNLREYLVAIDHELVYNLIDISECSQIYGSQFFRRQLQNHFKLSQPWDWKEYYLPEQMLIDTLKQNIF